MAPYRFEARATAMIGGDMIGRTASGQAPALRVRILEGAALAPEAAPVLARPTVLEHLTMTLGLARADGQDSLTRAAARLSGMARIARGREPATFDVFARAADPQEAAALANALARAMVAEARQAARGAPASPALSSAARRLSDAERELDAVRLAPEAGRDRAAALGAELAEARAAYENLRADSLAASGSMMLQADPPTGALRPSDATIVAGAAFAGFALAAGLAARRRARPR